MANQVNITVTLDQSQAIAQTTALNKTISDIGTSAQSTGQKATSAFNGIESSERQAHIAAQLFTRTLGVEMPRALETVIAKSQALGPLLQAGFQVAIFAAAASAIKGVYDKIVDVSQAAGGYTEQVKQIYAETVKASQVAFLSPTTLAAASQNMMQIQRQQTANNQQIAMSAADRMQKEVDESSVLSRLSGWAYIRAGYEELTNSSVEKGMQLEDQRRQILEKETQLAQQMNAAQDQIVAKAKEGGLQGYALAQQKYTDFSNSATLGVQKVTDPKGAAAAQEMAFLDMQNTMMQLRRQNAQETMNLQHQVTEDALTGEGKIYQAEADQLQTLKSRYSQSLIDQKEYYDQRALIAQQTSQRIVQYEQQQSDRVKELENEAALSGLSGDQKIIESANQRSEKERQMYARGQEDYNTYNRGLVAIAAERDKQIATEDEAEAQKQQQLLQQLTAAQQRAAEDTKVAQEDAALAVVPAWQQATAQIEIELNRRLRSIQDEETKQLAANQNGAAGELAIEQDAQAKRYDVWVTTDAKIRQEQQKTAEQLGTQMEQVFTDVGSGKIGTDILNAVKKLFFQILAQWILTTQQMGGIFQQLFGALTGNTSMITGQGGLLGGLFGMGGASSGVNLAGIPLNPVGGIGGVLGAAGLAGSSPGVAGLIGSSTAGATASSASITDVVGAALGLGSPATASSGIAANALTSSSIASTLGGSVASGASSSLAAPKLGSSLGSLFSTNMLTGLAAAGLPILGSLGGATGQIGGVVSSLAIMAAMNPTGVAANLLSKLGLFGGVGGAILAAAGPALLGFGLGQNFGPLGGALVGGGTGFATGALIGLAGGPIGALIGGLVGLIGGLFGGLFGGSKRKKEANNYFTQQVDPQVKSIVQQYESFQLDYATATNDLSQLQDQAQKQLHSLKGEGDDVFKNKVLPDIQAATQQIGRDDVERTRRAGLTFGPAQFHDGGLVNAASSPYTTRPQEMLALLKHGEFVVNPSATARYAGALNTLNSTGNLPMQHGPVSITIMALDAKNVDNWMRAGGAQAIWRGLNRYNQKEGNS